MSARDGRILKDDCRLYHLVEKLENDNSAVAQGILRVLIAMDMHEELFVAPKAQLDRQYEPYLGSREGTTALILGGSAVLHMLRKGHLGCTTQGGHCDPVALSARELKLLPRVFAKPDKVVDRTGNNRRTQLEITRKMWKKTYVLVVTVNKRFTRADVITFYNGLPKKEKRKLSETAKREDVC